MNKTIQRYKGKWIVFQDDTYIHVLPETDIEPHSTDTSKNDKKELADIYCPCLPKIDWTGKTMRITHNSFQDKEYLDTYFK